MPQRQRHVRQAAVLALLGVLPALAGCSSRARGAQAAAVPPAVPVRAVPASRQEIVQTSVVTGTVTPGLQVQLSSAIPGQVAAVHVELGDRVQAGQPLVQLDDREARAQLQRAEAALAQARSAAEEAAKSRDRLEALFLAGAVSQQQIDQARAGAVQAQAALQQAAAAAEQARLAVEHTVIRAPAAGVVAERRVEPGAWVAPGVPLLTLVDVSRVHVDVQVSEQDAVRLEPGQEVTVRVPSLGATLRGTLQALSPTTTPGQKTYAARVTLENPEGRLRGGMYVEVQVATRRETGIAVPTGAVIERGGEKVVFVVENGKARERRVRTGLADADRVLVEGVAEGARVVVAGQDLLTDGTPVTVSEEAGGSGGGSP
ncbi:efflux RND transporter periplasmic adaptor subunit [Caldinitratiruptor microaerophilus]|uniref:Hemolysin D n=1 Tax=Caldinitratiruptor microaerophilus TaxID=671077 RepID=A0AA35CIV3_9FIRM|nr:efflux RND transporter periplasmic adaptor subunit [Caldinitratiruptor microaerophilus]BDG59274.1 hemolysin D [Caldinitratiruptor microaerophilus]